MRPRTLRLLLAALALATCAAAPAPERAQRSANLSHITGTSRNIQMFLKNRYLQLLPDGTVNGTTDVNSVHTILQRATYKVGLLTIQGVATCLYLCMDACGYHYAHYQQMVFFDALVGEMVHYMPGRNFGGPLVLKNVVRYTCEKKDLSDDCMFEENIEENNYNTYSRIRGGKKTYLALGNNGKSRRTQIALNRPLGNLSVYALTLTRRWEGPKQTQCPVRRHRGKLKRPPPFRSEQRCQIRVQKQLQRQKRKHKKVVHPKKKHRHPKTRRKHDGTTSTTTTESYDESTMSTMSTTTDMEFFRSQTAQ